MVTGVSKKIIPYFNLDHQDFNHEKKFDVNKFSADVNQYVLHKGDQLSFNLLSYLDLISAPYYVLVKERDSGFRYPSVLVRLFKEVLFPTPDQYEHFLKENIGRCGSYLKEVEEAIENESQVGLWFDPIQNVVEKMQEKFGSHTCKLYPTAYLEVSKKYFNQLVPVVNSFTASLKGISQRALSRYYHSRNPQRPSQEKPLAFFQHFFLGDGHKVVESEYWYEVATGGCSMRLSTYIEKEFICQAKKAFELLGKRLETFLKERRKIEERVAFVHDVCTDLNLLYRKALAHSSTKSLVRCHQVFQWLSLMLKAKYPEYNPNTKVNDLAFRGSLIKRTMFMKRLGQLKVSGAYQGVDSIVFCRPKYYPKLIFLLAGNTNRAKGIVLNGFKSDVYYFIFKLLEKSPFFKLTDLQKCISIQSSTQPFNIRAYYTFVCEGRDSAPSKQAIDSFFSRNLLEFNQDLSFIEG